MNPVNSLSSALVRSAKPAAKVSAALAVSGGMVASFALPASASPIEHAAPAATTGSAHPAVAGVALSAPSAAGTTVASPAFGQIGFTGVAKPKPAPAVKAPVKAAPAPKAAAATTHAVAARTAVRASRSATRTALPVAHRAAAPAPAPAPAPAAAPASSGVLSIAAAYAGVPYVYGGATPAGFDCSGYTQYVFARAGISLPRTAEAQRQAVTRVSTPQPGDLVFFGAPAYHVGIYAGGGMMWDAPRTGPVVSKRAIWTTAVTYGRP